MTQNFWFAKSMAKVLWTNRSIKDGYVRDFMFHVEMEIIKYTCLLYLLKKCNYSKINKQTDIKQ